MTLNNQKKKTSIPSDVNNRAPRESLLKNISAPNKVTNKNNKKLKSDEINSVVVQKFLQKTSSQFSELTAIGFNKTFICCKESVIESPTSFYGCFYLGPFPESLSLTLSHNIRRTLLSEIPGLAITAVEIDGVLHKYSNIPGIKETVIDILANIQNIVLVKTRLANSFIAFLKVRGPGIVKASDMRLPAGVQLVNPDQQIATLAEDGVLNIKFWINEGKNAIKQKPKNAEPGPASAELNSFTTEPHNLTQQSWGGSVASMDYVSLSDFESSLPQEQKTQSGQRLSHKIYLDAVFMPVTKVNAFVETNFKATDDPIKKGPFIFGQSGLESTLPLQRSDLGKNNRYAVTAQKASEQKTNYLTFSSSSDERSLTNYLQFNYVGKSNRAAEQPQIQTSHSKFDKTSLFGGYENLVTKSDPAGLVAIQKNMQSYGLSKNPIVLAPSTYNQPTKQCHIVLEIWTNGSIHPRQALKECLDFLAKTFISLNNVKILGSMYKSHMTYKHILQKSKVDKSN